MSSNTHQPLGVGRNPPLQSVATPGLDSDSNLPYRDSDGTRSTTALHMNTNVYSPSSRTNGITSPSSPYSPGMRSAGAADAPGGIALQDFGADGLPPPPPVSHSWKRIVAWAEENYYEVYDQLSTPASVNDINELEYQLDCSLPMEIRESLQIVDGQERGGRPTGIIFGCMLMDCEEMLDEWKNWRKVEVEYMTPRAAAGPSGSATGASTPASSGQTDLAARQDSHPEGSVQKVYSHPGWIPMARDWGGNYIAVDLAPGPKGTWGQIILFGRDYDCKFVVSKSWAHFLAMVADDMQSPHWYVDEENAELKLKDPKAPKSEPGYMEILRVRNERKYGRRRMRRPGSRPGSKPGSAPGSPHLSALSSNGARGGLTRPAKEEMDTNHLMPPTKKSAKALRSVTEEPAVPAAVHKSENDNGKDAAGGNLLDSPAESPASNIEALAEVSLNDDDTPSSTLKRSDSDLISHPPVAAVKGEA